jgi:hypothetical protein
MNDAPFRRFLIVFDASTCAEPEVREFDAAGPAMDAYEAAEAKYRGRPEIHVVLIGSDSLETVKKTHGNYWGDTGLELIKAALANR